MGAGCAAVGAAAQGLRHSEGEARGIPYVLRRRVERVERPRHLPPYKIVGGGARFPRRVIEPPQTGQRPFAWRRSSAGRGGAAAERVAANCGSAKGGAAPRHCFDAISNTGVGAGRELKAPVPTDSTWGHKGLRGIPRRAGPFPRLSRLCRRAGRRGRGYGNMSKV